MTEFVNGADVEPGHPVCDPRCCAGQTVERQEVRRERAEDICYPI